MIVPKIYRNTISQMEFMFGLVAIPLPSFNGEAFLFCHHQKPNNYEKKIAVRFNGEDGEGYDVYDYDKELEYDNMSLSHSDMIGPAIIKNIETIFPDIHKMRAMTARFHGVV
ncbi:MAG: hypothetical protein IKN15_00805 [Bacteroidaceae bacterium]|nr:hypothetical protein [Bacteroidaceae bacterium]